MTCSIAARRSPMGWLVVLALLAMGPASFARDVPGGERERVRAVRLTALQQQLVTGDPEVFMQALAELVASDEPGALDVWERAIAAADDRRRPMLVEHFAAVRDRLVRAERVVQVVRLAASPEQLHATRAALDAVGRSLNVTVWQADPTHVIAAVSPAARARLAEAGIASELVFGSVAEWQQAKRTRYAAAEAITPHYQSAAAAREVLPRVLVLDLAGHVPVEADTSWLADRENVIARNDRYLAYLDMLPARRQRSYLARRYRRRGWRVAGVFNVADFPNAASRFFPELGSTATAIEGAAASFAGQFHSYEEVVAELQDLAARYPDLATVVSLGPTYEGREIWALKVSRDVGRDDPQKPDVLFTGCHHAREWIAVEPPMFFAHRLLDDYATDETVRFLVDHTEVWLVPIVNPDGLSYSQQSPNGASDSVRYWRKNRRPISTNGCGSGVGVDLNRNYSFMWRLPGDQPCPNTADDVGASDSPADFQLYRGPAPLSELEVQALATLTANPAHNFMARVDFHNYSQLVLSPWGYTNSRPADASTLAALGNTLAQRLMSTNGVHYTPEPAVGLYVTTGSSTDYAYGIDHTIGAFLWELRPLQCCFYVPESQIDPINRESWNGARTLIDWSVGPPFLTGVVAMQQSGGGLFDVPIYQASWQPTGDARALSATLWADILQPGPLRLALQFSKPLPPGVAPVVTLGRAPPFNEVVAVASAPGEGWQATSYGNDTWVGEVNIPAYGDATANWQLAVDVVDGAGLALDAQPATVARYGFGTDSWQNDERAPDLNHVLPSSTSLGPLPGVTSIPTRSTRPTSTATPTRTPTRTPTPTWTRRPTFTPTFTWTRRPTVTPTSTWTRRPTGTATRTWTRVPTRTATRTPTATWTRRPTLTPTSTWTRRPTATVTRTWTRRPSATPTPVR